MSPGINLCQVRIHTGMLAFTKAEVYFDRKETVMTQSPVNKVSESSFKGAGGYNIFTRS
jgi:hypothetical protein